MPDRDSSVPLSPRRSTRRAPARNASPFDAMLRALEAAAAGDFSQRAGSCAGEPDRKVRLLARAVDRALQAAEARLKESAQREQAMAEVVERTRLQLTELVERGNLKSWQSDPSGAPALKPLLDAIAQVVETLRTFVRETNEAALRLSSSAHEVLAASTQHESASTEQAAAIHETTATMEELKHASAQIAENAGAVARVAEETLGAARSGKGAIAEFVVAMQHIRKDGMAVVDSVAKLSKRVERIGTVVEVIDEIADRSDLLALNAALEGSRAGEAGRGFSIVAAEMRRLAENVMESTREIKSLIAEIRDSTQAAAAAADASRRTTEEGERLSAVASSAVEGILSGVQETSDAARVINLATQQQRTATEQVVTSMSEIEEVTRQTAQASRQATTAASELAELATRLASLITRFTLE